MNSVLPRIRTAAAACLLLASGMHARASLPVDEAFASLQTAFTRAAIPSEQTELHGALFALVFSRVQRSYATEVDLAALASEAARVLAQQPPAQGEPAELFKKSVNAALKLLDPYSRYLDARAYADERTESTGSFVGLGIEVETHESGVRITSPMPGGPAEKAGILKGDLVVSIDGHPIAGLPLGEATSRMRGEVGTTVALGVRRAGEREELSVTVRRDTIRRQALRWSMEGEVLVLRLRTFSGPVATQLADAIRDATAAHSPQAVVLDLRGNAGGLLREGVKIADAFLSKGEIVSLRSRSTHSRRSWEADADEYLAGLPMVVLIDERSASAAELVADALHANGRAKLMGTRSYGKGSVQTTYPLGEQRGALKLTTSIYHGPTGRTVQKTGLDPDIEVVGIAKGTRPPVANPKARVEPERCAAVYKAADPALSCAVAYLLGTDLEALGPASER